MNFYLPVLGTVLTGIHEMVQGMGYLAEGKLQKATQEFFFGMAHLNVPSNEILTKWSLLTGTLATVEQGSKKCMRGFSELNLDQIIKGIAQSTLGLSGSFLIAYADAKTVQEITQVALLTATSGVYVVNGVREIANGKYKKGVCEALLGLSGLALSISHIYETYKFTEVLTPSEYIEQFAFKHREEIDFIQRANRGVGNWKVLGRGKSKVTYIHPELEKYVIKFPLKDDSALQDEFNYNYVAREICIKKEYLHLDIPESYLIDSPRGEILVQRKLHFALNEYGLSTMQGSKVAIKELFNFCREGKFCDILPATNAMYLKGTENDPIFGIFDFDCHVSNPLEHERLFEILAMQESFHLSKAQNAHAKK